MAKLAAPETIETGSSYLQNEKENEGFYLMKVIDAHEGQRPTKDGLVVFEGISFECEVVGGPNDGQKFTLKLYFPKMSSKDGGKSASGKIFSFLVATDVVTPELLGKEFEFDPEDAIGSLFFIELALGKPSDDGKQYLDLKWMNVYHVDDPRAAKIKMDDHQKSAIANISEKLRHKDAAYFAKIATTATKTEKKAEKPNFDSL